MERMTPIRSKRRTGCGLLTILLVAVIVAAFVQRERILTALFDRAVGAAMAPKPFAAADMHILFCGTGSPMPSRDRAEACTAVIAGGRLFIFDAGEGSARNLTAMQAPFDRMGGVFLTHLHSDHINGLGNLALQHWVGSNATAPLALAGPTGTALLGEALNSGYRADSGYRTAHHGAKVAPPSGFGFAPRDIAPGVVYDAGGVRITAFAVSHAPVEPAFGYRIDWAGRSVTISGDTAPTPALTAAARGSDILVSELLNPALVGRMERAARAAGNAERAKIFADIPDYHISPPDAGRIAADAGVKQLIFTHIVPAVPTFMTSLLIKGADEAYSGPIHVAADGDVFSIAPDRSIAHSNRF
jgi:ribonuclease Z